MKRSGRIVKRIFLFLMLFQYSLGVSIMPQVFYIDLEDPATQELVIINDTNKPIRFKVGIIASEETEWMKRAIEQEWVRFYPKIVSVGPQSEGVARFRVNPPKGIGEGEYKAYLSVEQLEMQKSVERLAEGEDINVGLEMMYDFNLSIYGQKGKMSYMAEVENLKVVKGRNKNGYSFDIKNTGNAGLRGVFKVSYLDKRKKTISEEEIVIGLIPMEQQKRITGDFKSFNNKAESVKFELYHFDFTSKKMEVKVFEKISSL